jgi:uncharacterized phage-associated protein
MNFREDKATALAAFFLGKAGGELEYLKLLKLMYLVERESLRQISTSVTGDVFYSMKRGPVMSATFDLIKDNESWIDFDHANWRRTIGRAEGHRVKLKRPFEIDSVLSPFELEVAGEVWARFRDVDQWDLVDWMHETFPEWQDTSSRVPIRLEDVFRAFGLLESDIEKRMKLQEQLDEFERLLGGTAQVV